MRLATGRHCGPRPSRSRRQTSILSSGITKTCTAFSSNGRRPASGKTISCKHWPISSTGIWSSLTKATFRDLLYPEGIERRTVWKDVGGGKRKSNKGYRYEQFEPVWRKLGYEAQQAQSGKIIKLVGHKAGTGEAHDE